MKPCHCICSIFTLDDGFLVLSIPVLKLRLELDGDDFQVAWVVVPGQVTVHTYDIHVGSLGTRKKNSRSQGALTLDNPYPPMHV